MICAAIPKAARSTQHLSVFETSPFRNFGDVSTAALRPLLPVKTTHVETGTPLAINELTSGGAALSARGAGRGGARNSATRESVALTAAQINHLSAAARHADVIGLPLNRMVTIHWEAAGIALGDMARATGRFVDLMSKALARHGSRTTWLWVHEGGDRKGGHCHLLAHVPASLVPIMTRLQRGWLRRITGNSYRARVIHSKPIGGRAGVEVTDPDLHEANLASALAYVIKGASPDIARQLGLERLEPGGRIIGKRCATSQNIGSKA